MKLKRFKHLQEKGMSDSDMLEILKCKVIPQLNISFDEQFALKRRKTQESLNKS